jgi:hypothetical protein
LSNLFRKTVRKVRIGKKMSKEISLGSIGSAKRTERRDAAENRTLLLQTAESLFAQYGVTEVNLSRNLPEGKHTIRLDIMREDGGRYLSLKEMKVEIK